MRSLDGTVRFVKNSVNQQTWWQLSTHAGGEVVAPTRSDVGMGLGPAGPAPRTCAGRLNTHGLCTTSWSEAVPLCVCSLRISRPREMLMKATNERQE